MKNIITILFLLASGIITSYAQVDKTDAKEQKTDRKQEIKENAAEHKSLSKLKVDYNLFRRQMIATKEYADERKKIPAIQKASKMIVKIVAYVDSVDADDSTKSLTGFIAENVGDNSTNIFELTYDRGTKKIVTIKPTGETSDIEQDEDVKKPAAKKTTVKKSKDDEDEDDPEEEKTNKKKAKDED